MKKRNSNFIIRISIVAAIAACVLTASGVAGASFMDKLQWKVEKHIGRATVEEMRRYYGFIEDPLIVGYVNRVGKSIAAVSHRTDIPYEFYVVDTDEVNAFAAPGGFIFVTRGLLEETETEEELAGVLAHEIGHVAAKHGAKRIKQLPLIIAGMTILEQKTDEKTAKYAGYALSLMQLHYSRKDEYEADRLGAGYAYQAGFDPAGMVSFFHKLEKEMPTGSLNRLEVAISSHPKTTSRMAQVEATPFMADTATNEIFIARGYASRNYYLEAIDSYKHALEREPENSAALNGIGQALFELGDWSAARDWFEKALKIEPKNIVALNGVELAGAAAYTEKEAGASPIVPAVSNERGSTASKLDGAAAEMDRTASAAAADRKNLNEELDELEKNFFDDFESYKSTVGKIDDNDKVRWSLVDRATAFFGGYMQAAEVFRETGRMIIDYSDEMAAAVRETRYRLERRDTLTPQALRAAREMAKITRLMSEDSGDLFLDLSHDAERLDRGYTNVRNRMRDIDISLADKEEKTDAFTTRGIYNDLGEELDSLDGIFKDNEKARGILEANRAGLKRAEVNFNAAILNGSQTRVFRKMLERRFGIKPETLDSLLSTGLGFGDAILVINHAAHEGVEPAKYIDGFDPEMESLDSFIAERRPEKKTAAGDTLILHLAKMDLRMLTGRRPLVAMALTPDPGLSELAPPGLQNDDPELALAISLYENKNYEEAKRVLNERGKNKPATALSHALLGMIYRNTGDDENALEQLKYAVKKDGKSAAIHILLGNTFADMERYEDALNEYAAAEKLDPGRASIHSAKGYALAMQGNVKDAEKESRKAVEIGGGDAVTFLNLGLLYYQQGRIAEALDAFQRSLEKNPDQPLLAEMADRLKS